MMHDEICTYEVAKLAKEKGFNWMPSMYFHSGVERDLREVGVNGANPNKIPHSPHISCPTQTQLQRWLREEKGIHISVEYEWIEGVDDWTFWSYIKKINNAKVVNDAIKSGFNTYELALEDALKYALENLL